MEIPNLLMKPFLAQLEGEFATLAGEIRKVNSPEAVEMTQKLEKKIEEVENLKARFILAEEKGSGVVPADLYDDFRQLKLDLRFMRRGWLKILSNKERLRKMDERRAHVSTFAA